MAVSFDPKQETNHFGTSNSGTSNSVFSSVELEIGAIISFLKSYQLVSGNTLIKC